MIILGWSYSYGCRVGDGGGVFDDWGWFCRVGAVVVGLELGLEVGLSLGLVLGLGLGLGFS